MKKRKVNFLWSSLFLVWPRETNKENTKIVKTYTFKVMLILLYYMVLQFMLLELGFNESLLSRPRLGHAKMTEHNKKKGPLTWSLKLEWQYRHK